MSIPIVIQARSSSTRLPNKVMRNFVGQMSMIEFQYRRLSTISDKVIIATSNNKSDDNLEQLCKHFNFNYIRGSLDNVMERLYQGYCKIKDTNDDYFIRVGGDDPFISPEGISLLEKEQGNSNEAMIYTSYDGGMSYGCASEMFNGKLFHQMIEYIENTNIYRDTKTMYREHTKPAFMTEEILNSLKASARKADVKDELVETSMMLSVDYPADFLICSHLANAVVGEKGMHFSHQDLIKKYNENKKLYELNKKLHSGFGE